IATDSAPRKCSLATPNGVPSAARIASVFFTTLSSARAPRSCRRNSVTSLPANPVHSVRNAARARLNFSLSLAIACAFSSLRIAYLSRIRPLLGGLQRLRDQLLAERGGVHGAPGALGRRQGDRFEIMTLARRRFGFEHRVQDGKGVLVQFFHPERD